MNKKNIIKVRNAVFDAASNLPLDDVMLGTIMAQGKLIASINNTPDQAIATAGH